MEIEFENIMDHIVESIRAAGYEPYDQLYGYMKTGDETYVCAPTPPGSCSPTVSFWCC